MKILQRFVSILGAIGVLFLAGCESTEICNMTPTLVPQNPSNKYTITMSVRGFDGDILQQSICPYIVINGEKHSMELHPDGNNVFVYDCTFNGVGKVPFYFELIYETNRNGMIRKKMHKSDLFTLSVSDKIVLAMNCSRGPVGTTVGIMGCGFNKADKIRLGDKIVPSVFNSNSSIEFSIPSIPCDRDYDVFLISNNKEFLAGTFHVDPAALRCSTDFIRLMNGESVSVLFMLDRAAPEGGLNLNISTDVPDSVIMPEVCFPAGERSCSVTVSGSDVSGKGTLFVGMEGFNSLEIPVEIGDISAEMKSESSSRDQPLLPVNVDDDVVIL